MAWSWQVLELNCLGVTVTRSSSVVSHSLCDEAPSSKARKKYFINLVISTHQYGYLLHQYLPCCFFVFRFHSPSASGAGNRWSYTFFFVQDMYVSIFTSASIPHKVGPMPFRARIASGHYSLHPGIAFCTSLVLARPLLLSLDLHEGIFTPPWGP